MICWRPPAEILCGLRVVVLGGRLGLGLSALDIRKARSTQRHVVVEKHGPVIDLFRERHPVLPETLEILQSDFFEVVDDLGQARSTASS